MEKRRVGREAGGGVNPRFFVLSMREAPGVFSRGFLCRNSTAERGEFNRREREGFQSSEEGDSSF